MATLRILQVAKPLSVLRDFLKTEAGGGFVLMSAAALALIVANSPLRSSYFAVRDAYLGPLSVLHWINDGLMALFFLLVGLEIKREFLDGQLATWERRILPGLAAAAGMAVPALIYVGVNWGDPVALRGWAVPSATDIAFALGVLAIVGSRAPASLKVFLTAVAVLDDMGAVAIIAIFYTGELAFGPLALALGGLAVLFLFNRFGVSRLWPYLLVGVGVWAATLLSGVHATLAGVAVAAMIPLRQSPARPDDMGSPLHRLEHGLQPWIAFAVVPIFGFANAGVSFSGLDPATAFGSVPAGILLGLFLGKQIGIFGAVWMAVRLGLTAVPAGASWRQVYGVALLCGIGFTMSLFIGELAFRDSEELMNAVKLGVLAGSGVSAIAGLLVLGLPFGARREARTAVEAA